MSTPRRPGEPAVPPAPAATVAELEEGLRFVHRMEMQTRFSLDRIESVLQAAIKVLHRAGVLHESAVEQEAEVQRDLVLASQIGDTRVELGRGLDKHEVVVPVIDCKALMPLCKARCCRLTVELDFQDLEDGLRWDYAKPYRLRRRPDDGYCVYSEPTTYRCDVYDKRPSVCRSYDCREDKRVWKDFANQIPADWDDRINPAPLVQIRVPGKR
jgi:Fe-S-cluster containining protein